MIYLTKGDKIVVERLPIYACNAANARHKQTVKTITSYDTDNKRIKLNKKHFHISYNKYDGIVFNSKTAKYVLIHKVIG